MERHTYILLLDYETNILSRVKCREAILIKKMQQTLKIFPL